MSYAIARQGVYRTINGEGALLGEPTVFVRLAGCSVGCRGCDTDYRFARHLDAATIAGQAVALRGDGAARWAWITGGEPTDQDLGPLADALRNAGFRVALATSGIRPVPPGLADWISVSPHAPGRPAQWSGHEVKLVAGLGGLSLAACDPRDYLSFPWRYVAAAHGRREAMADAMRWAESVPGWRLGVQAHKAWGLA